ncbi:MAG: SDR family oxidoreductase [Chloroflexi bacterium]|nr:SDR family oxidoreductase [Chloroflexota bacterium]
MDMSDAGSIDLRGQVAIVTGGGRGIGRAIAERLAAAGAAVAVLARTSDQVQDTAQGIERSGGKALALMVDVTDGTAVEETVARTERDLGPVDLLVNNAAVVAPLGPVWAADPDEWWRAVEINLRGPFLCTRAVLPGMLARRRGRIVNVAAVAAYRPAPFTSSYAASKAALVRLTDTLAVETRDHGISVFAVRPGMVQTAMQDQLSASSDIRRLRGGRTPALVPASRAADAIAFLATGRGDALSGRFIDAAQDDVAALVERADEIVRDDLLAMRLRE